MMLNIKKFIDKVSSSDNRGGSQTFILHISEARALRDEVVKLIAENYELLNNKKSDNQDIKIEINGGKW